VVHKNRLEGYAPGGGHVSHNGNFVIVCAAVVAAEQKLGGKLQVKKLHSPVQSVAEHMAEAVAVDAAAEDEDAVKALSAIAVGVEDIWLGAVFDDAVEGEQSGKADHRGGKQENEDESEFFDIYHLSE
jgi:hypothetical protein